MSKGLYFYKLVSPYEEDVTKNCKLTVNEIDSNFLNLKDVDIKDAELDEATKSVILTRNNGDKLVVDLSPVLSGAIYDLKIEYDNQSGSSSGATVFVTYSILDENDEKVTVEVPIDGLITTSNIDSIYGGKILTRVVSNGTLMGEGTLDSPLGISLTEMNRPAVKLIDKTIGEELPETFTRGTRYITKEFVSIFGYLYNFDSALKIQEKLDSDGNGWRIPTKSDWDCLLNSIEPCEYQNHDSSACHRMLGKYAGQKLKADCGWNGSDDCECINTIPVSGQTCSGDSTTDEMEDTGVTEATAINECGGTDEFGMSILPTGYGDEEGNVYYTADTTVFWTSTHVYDDPEQDLYVKKFDWNKCGVIQEAVCTGERNAIRLVKDYTGSNHFETEFIDGDNYNTILSPDCRLIWTASNFASNKTEYKPTKSLDDDSKYNRIVYYINVWNGVEWEKRSLSEGETVVIEEDNETCQYNIEYRVYMADECNQALVNVDDTVVTRVLDRVVPLIDQEREERIEADNFLSGAIDTEIARAQEVEGQLWDGLNGEIERAQEVEAQLWDGLAQEASARTDVDNQLWDAINNESARAQEVEAQLWNGLAQEAAAREEVDNQQWAAIENEARIREEIDNQQWEAINNEIARAKAREDEIDGQLIDVSYNPYILSVNPGDEEYNLVFKSKDENEDHFIKLKINSDFGSF